MPSKDTKTKRFERDAQLRASNRSRLNPQIGTGSLIFLGYFVIFSFGRCGPAILPNQRAMFLVGPEGEFNKFWPNFSILR
jgi:hypothetical protein